jgi:hypothetical protein
VDGTTAALLGALIGAAAGLGSGILASYVALRNERTRHREAQRAAHVTTVREHTATFFDGLFAIHFAANWVAWFAAYDADALDQEMVDFYDKETYQAFPKLLRATAMVAALNADVYGELKPLMVEVYKLWERVMHGLHRIDTYRESAVIELRECLPDAMALEFKLMPQLAHVMEIAQSVPNR